MKSGVKEAPNASLPGRVVLKESSNFVQQTPLIEVVVKFTNRRRAGIRRGVFVLGKRTMIYRAAKKKNMY